MEDEPRVLGVGPQFLRTYEGDAGVCSHSSARHPEQLVDTVARATVSRAQRRVAGRPAHAQVDATEMLAQEFTGIDTAAGIQEAIARVAQDECVAALGNCAAELAHGRLDTRLQGEWRRKAIGPVTALAHCHGMVVSRQGLENVVVARVMVLGVRRIRVDDPSPGRRARRSSSQIPRASDCITALPLRQFALP